MSAVHLITTTDFCNYYQLEHTFINDLHDAGLIEITIINQTLCIPDTELGKLERMIRLHTELDIDVAGIEAISHLLQRVNHMQEEIRFLKNRLKSYE